MLRQILNKYSDATCTRAIHAITEGLDTGRIARIARISVARPIKTDFIASGEPVSNWWLVSYADIENVQLAIWPPCTHAEALAFNPTALSATPMRSPHTQTVNIDTPQALLDLMRVGGYSVSVNGDSLEVSQAQWIDDELAYLIRIYKDDLITILEKER